ncbi:MAG: DUF1592 domain-containing protein [Rhodobacteraceae bacterium]|nr:DUF1592 domain-containing protein [Paracoccaceae bacterium]
MRLLNEAQFRRIIADVFGPDIIVGGRFDPLVRSGGLLAVGAGKTSITGSSLERFDILARSIAGQVVAPVRRDWLIPCKPADATMADPECARAYFKSTGRLLYRRALTSEELETQVQIAGDAATNLNDFYGGLSASLAAMLTAPEFLFIVDTTEPDPNNPGQVRLTAEAMASRLSFFLWNTTPDDTLLTAAERGELHTTDGLKRQADRMMTSARFETGIRAFFDDMLAFDSFDTFEKDGLIYPAFSLAAANDAREQTLRTLVDLLLVKNRDYREIFTSRETFVSGALGLVYRVPVADPESWSRYMFPPDDERVGIQSQASLVALRSHPGRSSATLRGKAVREILMCQKVPDPPPNVDFTLVSDSANPIYKTARQRLGAHSTEPSCAGCHKLMDPIGLTFETLDGGAQFRTLENGEPIDTSGELDGIKFADAAGLGQALYQNPAVPSCVLNRLYNYATGRESNLGERDWLIEQEKQFADSGYKIPALVRRIVLSDAMYAITPADTQLSGQPGTREENPS